jgi:hypothetical protein
VLGDQRLASLALGGGASVLLGHLPLRFAGTVLVGIF